MKTLVFQAAVWYDNQGNISIGPFYYNEGITGKGEKFTFKKKFYIKENL